MRKAVLAVWTIIISLSAVVGEVPARYFFPFAADVAHVSGRVIGDNGKPVAGAFVAIAYAGGYSLADGESDVDGKFDITFAGPIRKTLYLFTCVSVTRPHEDGILIGIPFDRVLWGDRDFAGIPFDMGGALTFDVGDVPLQYHFNDVHVRLTRNRRKLSDSEWQRLWVRLKDERGRIVWQESFAPTVTDKTDIDSSEMRILLPEGKWSFEFQRYVYGETAPSPRILGKTPGFVIRRNGETTELCVELSDF